MAWEEVKLKELISEMGDGGTPTTTEPSNFGGNIPWAVVDDVVSNIRSTKESLTEKGFKGCSAKKWPIGSIILTTGATIGQVGIAEIELCTKQGITGIVVNNYANAEFLKFFFESNTKQLLRFAQGTTFKEIRPRTLGNLLVLIPKPFTSSGLAEQTAIATILSKVDKAIAATQNSIKAAEKLKKALMQNLLTGKLKPDGSWRTEDEFYETKIGRIPVDWTLVKTKDFCEKVTDGTHDTPKPNNTGFPLVTSKNLKVNGVDFNDCYLISEQDYNEINKRSKVEQYDILFGMIGTVGNPQIVMQNPVEFAIKNVGLFRMNGNQKLSLWLKNYLASDIFRVYQQRQQAGTTQQFVSLGFLRKIPVPIPMVNDEINYSLIDGINKKIEIADSELISKQTKIQTLQRLKKSLMQNLLTGKVRLPQEFIAQFEEVEETIKS